MRGAASPSGPDENGQGIGAPLGQPTGLSIRWDVDSSGTTTSVSVVGLPPSVLKEPGDPSAWFSIAVGTQAPRPGDRPAMLGTYRVEGDLLRFTPRYPFDRGRTYSATLRPSLLPGGSGLDWTMSHSVPKPPRPATVVAGVTPSADRVPENLLKFYLFFSAPMSRGEVNDRVRLLKEDGRPVDLPFLRLAEELWDPSGTRLTLLVDPGRIKRGLRPREEAGPVLEAGRSYTLVIDPGWPDAEGNPLALGLRKSFRAEGADEAQPDPKTWAIDRPAASTRDPLIIRFPEALDRALIESALALVDPRGEAVPGRLGVTSGETRWRFTPDDPWAGGDYQLVVDADLEDLAGNSILRPFEVDIQRDTPSRPEAKTIRLPIPIRPALP